ncbi:PIG-L deacetylase family protein [Pseudonocardia sp. ICBG601]|uniref:PIG-L deacetylase family protein n=1 Tax=Pseudonocardia sp. ICBG601 TaxID=2846759 RepID=UPI0035AB81D2
MSAVAGPGVDPRRRPCHHLPRDRPDDRHRRRAPRACRRVSLSSGSVPARLTPPSRLTVRGPLPPPGYRPAPDRRPYRPPRPRTRSDHQVHTLSGQTVLALHAHPDDESIFTGLTLRRLADAGARVVLVMATGGDLGGSRLPLEPGETVPDRRRRELADAASAARRAPAGAARAPRLRPARWRGPAPPAGTRRCRPGCARPRRRRDRRRRGRGHRPARRRRRHLRPPRPPRRARRGRHRLLTHRRPRLPDDRRPRAPGAGRARPAPRPRRRARRRRRLRPGHRRDRRRRRGRAYRARRQAGRDARPRQPDRARLGRRGELRRHLRLRVVPPRGEHRRPGRRRRPGGAGQRPPARRDPLTTDRVPAPAPTASGPGCDPLSGSVAEATASGDRTAPLRCPHDRARPQHDER